MAASALRRLTALAGLLAASLCAQTPLIEAAKKGDAAAVRSLIAQKADVNQAAPDGTTALHWASHLDELESAEALLRAGANVNATTDLGVTPLWLAGENGSAAMVRLLIGAKADPNIALLSGETPLMVAARTGNAEAVDLIASAGADVNAHGTRKQTALMWAVSQKHPEAVRALLKYKPDLHLKSEMWEMVMAVPPHGHLPYNKAIPHGGETALMFAARVGDLESAKLLVEAGANVNDTDAWGVSAVNLAAHSGFTELVEYLLEKGADPNAAACGFHPLHVAVMRRDARMVKAMLEHGAKPDPRLETWTPTRRSSEDWHFDPAWIGATPLWLAARIDEPEIMRLLVEHGADPKFVHNVEWYAEVGFGGAYRQESSTILLAALNIGNGAPWLPLPNERKEAQTLEAVKLALEWGVDINAESAQGRTALDAARQLRYQSVIDYLTARGAKPGRGPEGGRGGRGRAAN